MRKIKVALVLPCFALGGAQRMVFELARSIDREHYEVCVVCYEESPAKNMEDGLRTAGIEVRNIGPFKKIRAGSMRQVASVLNEYKPDVVHAHLGGAQLVLFWCALHRIPLVITLHTTMPKALNFIVEKIARLDSHGGLIKLVAVSPATREQAIYYFGCDRDRILEVDNGIELGDYQISNPVGSAVFINVGTQNRNKNQRLLLEAFQEVVLEYPDSRLILIGDGPEHDALISEARYESKVELPGSVTNVPEWLARANVYVQCSYREAMPMSVIEAIASGLPVITTNVGGVGDVVRDGREGLLINPGSKDELVNAMLRLCDVELRSEYSSEALLRAKKYSSIEMARNYERIYEQAVTERD